MLSIPFLQTAQRMPISVWIIYAVNPNTHGPRLCPGFGGPKNPYPDFLFLEQKFPNFD